MLLVPSKQLLGNESQTTAHAGYVKSISEMLGLLVITYLDAGRSAGYFSSGFLDEGYSVSGRLVFYIYVSIRNI